MYSRATCSNARRRGLGRGTKELFDGRAEHARKCQGDADARLHAPVFDRAHGLPRDARRLGERTLRKAARRAHPFKLGSNDT